MFGCIANQQNVELGIILSGGAGREGHGAEEGPRVDHSLRDASGLCGDFDADGWHDVKFGRDHLLRRFVVDRCQTHQIGSDFILHAGDLGDDLERLQSRQVGSGKGDCRQCGSGSSKDHQIGAFSFRIQLAEKS